MYRSGRRLAPGELPALGAAIAGAYDRFCAPKEEAIRAVTGPQRRPRGTGSLLVHDRADVATTWYGSWRAGGRQIVRKLGPRTPAGLSQDEAEAELARRSNLDALTEDSSISEVAPLYLAHAQAVGRRRSTIDDYESYTRVHLVPFFGNQPMSRITPLSVERYVSHEIEAGSAVKSVYNYLVLLNTLFRYPCGMALSP